jgi:hypothetical protein
MTDPKRQIDQTLLLRPAVAAPTTAIAHAIKSPQHTLRTGQRYQFQRMSVGIVEVD